MSLEEFLHNLHFDIDKVSPPDWEVDWEDAPLPYKLYRGLPVVPFSLEVPIALDEWFEPSKPDHRKIGNFLWFVSGLTQYSQSVFTLEPSEQKAELIQSFRRFAPSGGALYPNELYVYLKMEDIPRGVYHYDVAHHRLVLLREGNFDSLIARALGNRCDISTCFGTIFVSTMFWKNFYKYNNFSYRLQGLDAGVLMGQLLEVAKRFAFESGVYFQFLDRTINHLLGLSEQEESTYAVIPLSVNPTIWLPNVGNIEGPFLDSELCQQLTPIQFNHYVRSRRIKEYPMLTKMNEACIMNSTGSFGWLIEKERMDLDGERVVLPPANRLSYDLAAVCKKRYSPDMDFVMGKVSIQQLANLLHEATASFQYRNDLDQGHESRISLYGCFYNVEGLQDGAYQYDSDAHALRLLHPGDHRRLLQYGMSADNVNLYQVPICLHVAGDKDHLTMQLGYRGYRIQQMEAGMLVQRLLIAASAIGMAGHPLLGYDANVSDEIYKLDSQGKTSLIQIPIGPYRNRPWLKGSLHS
ncbi:SagB family peptide dehydrogenase [Peribacillus glennii]|uniref:SagB/ThcOx family dehydrogenase n=1 Tax=Peribacillus glennii TaxID=2303991 RepID=A0A372LFY0_9BACI|nr:SagB family peptide dehydrogenase [Peribacillus glennii]RFU65213.1 SagB/ThcOx family dehydrogenase [Peribacillus glennii]